VDVIKGSCVILRGKSVFVFLLFKVFKGLSGVSHVSGQDQVFDDIRCIG